MIVATRPLIDCCPVVPAAMEGRQMVQWDKDSCADAGFLKIDLLGLGMLSAVERCVEEIARVRGERIDLSRIPFDDRETFSAIRAADTVGVFQIESRAQMQSLLRTRPENLEDLTIQVAIMRPGPIQGGAVNPYIERRQRLREDPAYEIPYEHPSLEPVLRETLGTIIFQDQVMEVAEAFAGFSPGRGRRAAPRDEPQALAASCSQRHRERFIEGALRHVGRRAGDGASASGRWSRASPASASPRRTAPPSGCSPTSRPGCASTTAPEFLCALLNEQPMGFYAPDSLVHEAERRGIAVLRARRQRLGRWSARSQDGGRAARARLRQGRRGAEEARRWSPSASGAGPSRSLGELAARVRRGARDARAARLVGRLRRPARPRRAAGSATGARRCGSSGVADARAGDGAPAAGTQLALPLELPARAAAARARALAAADRRLRDQRRDARRPRDGDPARAPDGADARHQRRSSRGCRSGAQVAVAGLVIARQRPGTANGTMFLLFEDEFGTVNLIVAARGLRAPPPPRPRRAAAARPRAPRALAGAPAGDAAPAPPRSARAAVDGATCSSARRSAPSSTCSCASSSRSSASSPARCDGPRTRGRARAPAAGPAAGGPRAEEPEGAEVGSSMRAVAPPIQSFAMGRRR